MKDGVGWHEGRGVVRPRVLTKTVGSEADERWDGVGWGWSGREGSATKDADSVVRGSLSLPIPRPVCGHISEQPEVRAESLLCLLLFMSFKKHVCAKSLLCQQPAGWGWGRVNTFGGPCQKYDPMHDFSGFTFLSCTLETAGPLPGFHRSSENP